ncbi:fimbrial assembly protein, partial [Salmonella enterica subsp. enterica serovar Heidelberg]|nr:fimbrial assembly protein [Salmonella enterica subsp. enterica serovar Heidelberg]
MFFRKYGVAAFIAMTLSAGSAMAADPDTGT